MTHGVVEVLAYQETLLIMAVFGIAVLAMVWAGFRRWLQHKETRDRVIAEQTAAHIERLEARLNAIEEMAADGAAHTAARIASVPTNPLPDPS